MRRNRVPVVRAGQAGLCESAQTIIENCGNLLLLRAGASEGGGTAKLASELIGDREVERDDVSRSRTRGRFPTRSMSMQTRRSVEDVTLASEIMQLGNQEGFVKRATSARWARVRFPYVDYPRRVEAAVPIARTEPTPERTAFVRFRKALIAQGLDRVLFDAMTAQLKAKAVQVKTGTIVDATIIASASEDDEDARWVKHKNKKGVHGFKAHVGADVGTALVEEVAVTPANVNDGRAGSAALPENPGDVFADSAYRGSHFREAVRARGGTARVVATGMWGSDEQETLARLAAYNQPIHSVRARSRDFRHLEAKLWPEAHAMARDRQSHRPSPAHRHRLQSQTNPHPHCSASLIHATRAHAKNQPKPSGTIYPTDQNQKNATRAQVSRERHILPKIAGRKKNADL